MKLDRRKWIGIAVLFLFIAGMSLGFIYAGGPIVQFISNPVAVRTWIAKQGPLAPILFAGMVAMQVIVAIIPGEPFEIAAGYAFGAWWGTALCMAGSAIGSLLVFLFVRRWGVKMVELFFPIEKVRSLRFLRDKKRLHTATTVLFLIPGTPKDVMTYAIGLTDMKLSSWMLISTLARIPSIVTSTIGGDALGASDYTVAAVVFGVTLLASAAGILYYRQRARKQEG